MNFNHKPSYYQVGGSLTNNAPNYVKRQADDDLYTIDKPENFAIFNYRQMGNLAAGADNSRLRNEGMLVLRLTFRKLATAALLPKVYAGLLRILENNLNCPILSTCGLGGATSQFFTPVQRLSEFIETVLLPNISSNIVIFIDEIDSILALDFPAMIF